MAQQEGCQFGCFLHIQRLEVDDLDLPAGLSPGQKIGQRMGILFRAGSQDKQSSGLKDIPLQEIIQRAETFLITVVGIIDHHQQSPPSGNQLNQLVNGFKQQRAGIRCPGSVRDR